MRLKDKVAIVTGSTGGIGEGIAARLASEGAKLVITSRNIDTAEKAAKKITDKGGLAIPCCFELEDPSSSEALLYRTLEAYHQLDILVNNAVTRPTPPSLLSEKSDYARLQTYITSNLTNVLTLTMRAYPYLKQTKGKVLNIGSALLNRHLNGGLLYVISKGGLLMMTKALAAEWAEDGIRVNQINPGFVPNDAFRERMPEELISDIIEKFRQYHPLSRVGTLQDIGAIAAFMLSDDTSWMTGSVVEIDGGYSIQGIPDFLSGK